MEILFFSNTLAATVPRPCYGYFSPAFCKVLNTRDFFIQFQINYVYKTRPLTLR